LILEQDGDQVMVARLEAYRARAAECDILAANSTDAEVRMRFTELAAKWRLLADRMEITGAEYPASQ
jgi:hypothetical protein